MKNNIIKKALAVILSSAVVITTLPQENLITTSAAKKNVSLNTTFKTLKIGKSYKLKLKNNTINWKIKKVTTSNKKICTVYNKKSTTVLLKGKNEGRATIKIKIKTNKRKVYNKKTLKCRVKVIPGKSSQTPIPDQPTVSEPESTYNIEFNTNGGNIISGQTVTGGNTITKPADPTKSGYIFKGWYSDISLQNAYDFTSIVTDNMTLYAKWNNTYKVEFQTNGGNKIEDQIIENGGIVSKPADPTRARSTFIGWFSDSQLKEPYDFSSAVTKDITIYARWEGGYEYPPIVSGGNDNYNKDDSIPKPNKYTVSFYINNNTDTIYQTQTIVSGNKISPPNEPVRDGFTFIGWSTEKEKTNIFDFNSIVNSNTKLYAQWINFEDNKDNDNDGIPDNIEKLFGLSSNKDDTDGDGLSDYMEAYVLGLNPLMVDTNGDGITDDKEDNDSDGLTNIFEIEHGIDPMMSDTDGDGLTDGEEINKYFTDPLNKDTDKDDVSDGVEVSIGTDPLTYQENFQTTCSSNENNDLKATVEVSLKGKQVETLTIEEFKNDTLFTKNMPGYIGDAYNFSVDGSFDEATISFEFDKNKLSEDAEPTIYYFDEKEQSLEELDTKINGNIASAIVKHFSTYVLIDRKIRNSSINQYSYEWSDEWSTEPKYTNIELVLVIDDSGSMDNNDPNYKRLTVAQELIDNLPEKSKVGVVRFNSNYDVLTESLLLDKNMIKSYLTTDYFYSSGGTRMFTAIKNSLSLFESNETTTQKIMLVLCDGDTSDTSISSDIINSVIKDNIKVYTIGLGDNISIFDKNLKPIASESGASFYLAANAEEFNDIFSDINTRIDIETDSDGDGIPDYYEEHMLSFDGTLLKLDKNNQDTDGDGLLDSEEIEVVLDYNYNEDKTKAIVTVKCIMKSNPTLKDSDGDGLLDNSEKWSNNKIIAPKDPEPLVYTGAKNVWNTHINQQKSNSAPRDYISNNGLNFELPDWLDSLIVKSITKLNGVASNEIVENILTNILGLIKLAFSTKWFGSEIALSAGAKILNFAQDDQKIAYHSQKETWQRDFGYNEFYDKCFRIGTNDNMGTKQFYFRDHNTDYALWLWKGDYWQFRSGAEIGLYTYSGNFSGVNHYDAIDYELPMTLYLYNYNSPNNIENVFSWEPNCDQWWITGFNPNYENPSPSNMTIIGSIDFSSKQSVYDALKQRYQSDDNLIFGDNNMVWIIWDRIDSQFSGGGGGTTGW